MLFVKFISWKKKKPSFFRVIWFWKKNLILEFMISWSWLVRWLCVLRGKSHLWQTLVTFNQSISSRYIYIYIDYTLSRIVMFFLFLLGGSRHRQESLHSMLFIILMKPVWCEFFFMIWSHGFDLQVTSLLNKSFELFKLFEHLRLLLQKVYPRLFIKIIYKEKEVVTLTQWAWLIWTAYICEYEL